MINNISDIIGTIIIIICVLFVHVGECIFALALGAELTFLSYILIFSKQQLIHFALKRAAAEMDICDTINAHRHVLDIVYGAFITVSRLKLKWCKAI